MKEVKYIYEDEDILVCHKPAGMATEGARVGTKDLVSTVRNYLARKKWGQTPNGAKGAKPPYVATVHRLDQPVEGIVVIAKSKLAAGSLTKQIKERTTDKYYYALAYGQAKEKEGHLFDFIGRKESDGNAIILSAKEKESFGNSEVSLDSGEKCRLIAGEIKEAELDYNVVTEKDISGKALTLFNIKLMTGRYHQIRAQLSNQGMPIVGDLKYGSKESVAFSEENQVKSICLVCYKFAFDHPKTKKRMVFEIEPDNTMIRKFKTAE